MFAIFIHLGMALRVILGFMGKNVKIFLPILILAIGGAFVKGVLDARERDARDQQIMECNDQILQDQLQLERKKREDAEQLAASLRQNLDSLRQSEVERQEYLEDLERQLDRLALEDDDISPRTRELLRRLNQRTRAYYEDNPS